MKLPLILFALASWLATASAAEFQAFRATVTLPFINATFQDETDRFLNTRVANKQLINLALGQPFSTKQPREVVVALLLPSNTSPLAPATLVILNTQTKAVLRTVATITPSSILIPDDIKKPGACLVTLTFPALSNASFNTLPFSLTGNALGSATLTGTAPVINLTLGGLHGRFTRNDPQLSIYAGVVLAAKVRAAGKPIVIIDL